jgi:broad specificity phosphatase PhoE
MKLYFIRHGENRANVERVMSYKIVDYPLTSRGVEQASYLADWLSNRKIVRVYSSPLKRAYETAEIVTKRLDLSEISVLEELRELNVGLLDGKGDAASWEIHDNIIRRWFDNEPDLMFEEGENHHGLRERLKQAVTRILAENSHLDAEQGVAVVAHGGLYTFGLPSLCEIRPDWWRRGMGNTAVTVFEVNGEQLSCTHWGLSEHLPPD